MPPARRAPPSDGINGGLWKWIAAVVGALLIGLTPFLLTQNAQRDYAQKDDLATLASSVVSLSERVARSEEQIQTVTQSVTALLELAQSGETRLGDIEATLARIEATIAVQPTTTTAP